MTLASNVRLPRAARLCACRQVSFATESVIALTTEMNYLKGVVSIVSDYFSIKAKISGLSFHISFCPLGHTRH